MTGISPESPASPQSYFCALPVSDAPVSSWKATAFDARHWKRKAEKPPSDSLVLLDEKAQNEVLSISDTPTIHSSDIPAPEGASRPNSNSNVNSNSSSTSSSFKHMVPRASLGTRFKSHDSKSLLPTNSNLTLNAAKLSLGEAKPGFFQHAQETTGASVKEQCTGVDAELFTRTYAYVGSSTEALTEGTAPRRVSQCHSSAQSQSADSVQSEPTKHDCMSLSLPPQ